MQWRRRECGSAWRVRFTGMWPFRVVAAKQEVGQGTSGALYELDPAWVPSLDGHANFNRMIVWWKELHRFEQRRVYAARVLIASSVGRQSESAISLILFLLCIQ